MHASGMFMHECPTGQRTAVSLMRIFGRRSRGQRSVSTDLGWRSGRVPVTGDSTSGLPANIVQMMDDFGRYEYDSASSGVDGSTVWVDYVAPLHPVAQANPRSFRQQLADAVLPVGGWCVYGAAHLDWELLGGSDADDPNHQALLSASLSFLRSCGVPRMRLTGYESSFWSQLSGDRELWLLRRPTPSPEEAPIRQLRAGEVRRIAVMESRPNSREVHVWEEAPETFTAASKSAWSEEDPREGARLQTAPSLYSLYVGIGEALQVEAYWTDPELRPYLPLPWPRIDWLPQATSPPT
jgi:hypothetical protein